VFVLTSLEFAHSVIHKNKLVENIKTEWNDPAIFFAGKSALVSK
jgi:hypothetical protein